MVPRHLSQRTRGAWPAAQRPSKPGAPGTNYAYLRLAACATNTLMIAGIYAEYLWAAEWVDDAARCASGNLTLTDALDCSRRYTFSDAMVHGHNLFWYSSVGSFATVVFTLAERHRIGRLRAALERAQGSKTGAAKASLALRCLKIYERFALTSFIIVMFLVPCHIDRPFMHYPCAVACFGFFGVAITAYIAMPLDFGGAADDGSAELAAWSGRRRYTLPLMKAVLVVEALAIVAAALHLLARYRSPDWCGVTGKVFGSSEVSLLLLFQGFVASFAIDDAAISKEKAFA